MVEILKHACEAGKMSIHYTVINPSWDSKSAAENARTDLIQRGWECSEIKPLDKKEPPIWSFEAKRRRDKTERATGLYPERGRNGG